MPDGGGLLARLMVLLLRIALLVVGVVLATAVLCLLLFLAAVWGLRYAWARLTGAPVSPWAPRFNARGTWNRFTRPEAASKAAASFRHQGPMAESVRDVTDVEAK